ncbi:hypothetical protein F0562_016882 [Nyssa sinensis]|uniref:Uncharacterized protein n=1 Tax=Nyssa sinensis TaxID=561372 RepID=A0A5J4ZG26_9ASTE|nr:hypothetical protein F0562_016882 [Nyssa sinensis]
MRRLWVRGVRKSNWRKGREMNGERRMADSYISDIVLFSLQALPVSHPITPNLGLEWFGFADLRKSVCRLIGVSWQILLGKIRRRLFRCNIQDVFGVWRVCPLRLLKGILIEVHHTGIFNGTSSEFDFSQPPQSWLDSRNRDITWEMQKVRFEVLTWTL